VPQFSAEIVAKLLKSARPNLLVGVPTLYDALAKDPSLAKSEPLVPARLLFRRRHPARPVKEALRGTGRRARRQGQAARAGYGLDRRAVTAIMAMPLSEYREGSIGIPFPDMDAKICRFGTPRNCAGEEGEICIAGPA